LCRVNHDLGVSGCDGQHLTPIAASDVLVAGVLRQVLPDVGGERFGADDVLSRCGCRLCRRSMQVVGNAEVNDIHLG